MYIQVTVLDSTPHLDMVRYLPEILDGLFGILEDPTMEIKKMCETLLGEFLKSISRQPENVDFCAMVNFLLINAQSNDELVQFTALNWLSEFLNLAGRQLLPYASGILTAILPHLEKAEQKKAIAETVNQQLKNLVLPDDDTEPGLGDVVRVLVANLQHQAMATRLAVLHWFHHLLNRTPGQVFLHIDPIFSALLRTLQDASEEGIGVSAIIAKLPGKIQYLYSHLPEYSLMAGGTQVVMMDLEVLAQIASSGAQREDQLTCVTIPPQVSSTNPYFAKFMVALLHMYDTSPSLLEDRGPFIIRELCLHLNAEDIYRTLAEILLYQNNLKFAATMVQTLNTILLTSSELFELRVRLNRLETEESWSLFCCLYRSWCHSPVATIALCLLTQNYKYACQLLLLFGDVEVTVEFLTEIDKLVQLIESPIFTYLRLQLLDSNNNFFLVKSLYALLMLLPQSEAFNTLRHRLACVPKFGSEGSELGPEVPIHPPSVDFDQLLKHFKDVQAQHHQARLPRRPPSSTL
ncbi:VAC14 [Cordylochernes scorpioides]|uniref:Protein VAC14 homolog n=1 Tax=Cordylochernes scorpioides TaxID=51811 RepID=A0ABY6KAL4_9ARAC|nr:VAC14 [Cordylochernes scorpioides]